MPRSENTRRGALVPLLSSGFEGWRLRNIGGRNNSKPAQKNPTGSFCWTHVCLKNHLSDIPATSVSLLLSHGAGRNTARLPGTDTRAEASGWLEAELSASRGECNHTTKKNQGATCSPACTQPTQPQLGPGSQRQPCAPGFQLLGKGTAGAGRSGCAVGPLCSRSEPLQINIAAPLAFPACFPSSNTGPPSCRATPVSFGDWAPTYLSCGVASHPQVPPEHVAAPAQLFKQKPEPRISGPLVSEGFC